MDAKTTKPKRADARLNRERIMSTAVRVLAELGVNAQMTDFAKAAGVSIGTLYRNFPSKEDLVHALALDRVTHVADAAQRAATAPDAWDALVGMLRYLTDRQLEDRVLSQFLGGRVSGSDELHAQRDAVFATIGKVVKRAQRDGTLRKDVNISDFRLIMASLAHLSTSDTPSARRAVHRHLGVVLDGLRAPGRSKLEGPRLSISELEDVVYPSRGGDLSASLRRGRSPWPRS